jgi:hypothetical protein
VVHIPELDEVPDVGIDPPFPPVPLEDFEEQPEQPPWLLAARSAAISRAWIRMPDVDHAGWSEAVPFNRKAFPFAGESGLFRSSSATPGHDLAGFANVVAT